MQPNSKHTTGRSGVFYGWWIVLATFAMAVYYSGAYFYSFTLFVSPITDDLGWSGTIIPQGFLITGVFGAILAPILGTLFDRIGPKIVVGGGMALGGLGFFILSQMTEPWHFYVGFSLAGIGPVAIYNGAVPAVANWFVLRRGRALGLTVAGLGIGGVLAPVSLLLIDALGWRGAMMAIALGTGVLLVPLSLVLRRRPEDHGALPDGLKVAPSAGIDEALQPLEQNEMSLREAVASPVFWLIALTFSLAFVPMGAIQVHIAPYLESVGLARPLVATAVTAMALTTVVGRLAGGWLADYVDARKATVLALGLQAVGTMVFAFVVPQSAWLLVLFVVAFAPGFGAITVLQPALQGFYMGRRAFGAIQGLLWTITSMAFSVAPLALQRLVDIFESYRPGYLLFGAISVIGVVVVLRLPNPRTTPIARISTTAE